MAASTPEARLMAGACPAPGPDDPLVRGLLTVVDCTVQSVVQTGYGAIFQPGGAFVSVLGVLMTLYVALIGYRLLLGRADLNVGELALTVVKLAAVLAFATQWGAYQALVYRFLFYGPEQVADVLLRALRTRGTVLEGNVFDGLQRALTDLTAFSPATPPGAPALATGASPVAAGAGQLSTLLSKAGFDSLLLLGSAVVLMLASLGVLLAAKIVLALLLALGPFFIALLLFESTQGLFAGWLRASLGVAFAPLAVTLTLGLVLTLLDPSLQQLETMRSSNTYLPGVAFGVAVLVAVFTAVTLGLLFAGVAIAAGLRLPGRAPAPAGRPAQDGRNPQLIELPAAARAVRIASAAEAQTRRDAAAAAGPSLIAAAFQGSSVERRVTLATAGVRSGPTAAPLEVRLGQQTRRGAGPRVGRAGPRSEGQGVL